MKILKAINSLFSGVMATAESVDNPETGVKATDYTLKPENCLPLLIESSCILEAKLEAAADALRRIECKTADNINDSLLTIEVHTIAQDAWRETQK